ncbi:MAG: MarR family winged helix-turn-helix transcriptional regulator [Mycobacteriales bacterium]
MRLSEDEVRRAVRVLSRLARAIGRADTGLTMPQYKLMVLLDKGDERSSRVAAQLAVSKPTITAAADGLVEIGFLRRTPDTTDKRVVWLQLTDAGRTALQRADSEYADRFAPLLEATSDPHALVSMLDEIDSHLDEARAARLALPHTPADGSKPDPTRGKKKVSTAR